MVVVPIGSVEQHGYHLPVATDTILADAVAKLGAERVANRVPLLVTPNMGRTLAPSYDLRRNAHG